MSFNVQERPIDPSTGKYLTKDFENQTKTDQAKRMYEDRLKLMKSKFANVPNAAFIKEPIPVDDYKMTLDKFRSITPFQAQAQAAGLDKAMTLRDQDDARAKMYQEQNNPKKEDILEPINTTADPVDGSIAEKLALLARKEKAFSAKLLELKAQEEKMRADKATMESSYIPKQKLVEDPFSVLKDNGLTYDQLTEKLLEKNGGVQDPVILELQSQVKELREQLLEQKSTVENKERQSYEQAIEVQRNAVTSLIDSDAQYELIKATNSHEDVVQMIVDTFKKSNILLSPMEAAQKVENMLYDETIKLMSVNKIKAKFGSLENSQTLPEPQQKEVINSNRTLTNQMQTDSHLPLRKRPTNWNDWKRQTLEKINNNQLT